MRLATLVSLSVLALATTVGCSSKTDQPASGTASANATAAPDTASFCDTLCGRHSDCDHSQDKQTCVSQCVSANAATLPKFRADLVSDAAACVANADCHSVLDEDILGGCVKVILVSIAPDAETQKFCSDLEAVTAKCGNAVDYAGCLDTTKRFGDATLSQAAACLDKACVQMADCVEAELDL